MKVTGINEIHADSRDIITEMLADGFEQKVRDAILETDSAKSMKIKRVAIEEVKIFGTQYSDGSPVGTFLISIRIPAKKYEMNCAVYKVFIFGGKNKARNTAYFESEKYVNFKTKGGRK